MSTTSASDRLGLTQGERELLWRQVVESIESYYTELPALPVAPSCDVASVRECATSFSFEDPIPPVEVLGKVVSGLRRYALHTGHPRSFGLFNPTPSSLGVAADTLVGAFNPQLAAWSHAPYAVEIERHLIKSFGVKIGMDYAAVDGTFTSGGAEANHTAVLAALTMAFPGFGKSGLRSLPGNPRIYVSAESHHSFIKAARACGLGTDSVVRIPVDYNLRMEPQALEAAIVADLNRGHLPFLVVATVGTTSAGAIDDVGAAYVAARKHGLWLHVDAAYGGCASLLPELAGSLGPLHKADSVTLDAHKGLSVPMAAGMFLTRRKGILDAAFAISTDYVPPKESDQVADPYAHSLQWSRRFIGLKLFMTLANVGWNGYAAVVRHQVQLAQRLRESLEASGWKVVHKSPLPVVCFVDREGVDPSAVVAGVLQDGLTWVSTTKIGQAGLTVIRACVTSYRSEMADVNFLIDALDRARARARKTS